jgi:hypothetical protein
MELKVVCQCGQKFKFDVEPVNGLMPFTVNCPVCGVDGTPAANKLLAEKYRSVPPPPPVSAAPAPFVASAPNPIAPTAPPPPLAGLRINRETHTAPAPAPSEASVPPPLTAGSPPPIAAVKPLSTVKKPNVEGVFSLGRGILGAFAGSIIGCGLLFAF